MTVTLEIHPSLLAISAPFKGVLLDAYGVFWGGNERGLLPGSQDAMENLFRAGKIVGILSNTTQLASKEIEKLQRHGLIQGKHFHFLITSGEVARYIFLKEKLPFETPRKTYWLFGGIHPKFFSHQAIFKETGYSEVFEIEQADFIYISIPHIKGEDQTDPEMFREEIKKIRSKNLPMICPNPDRFAHEGEPPKAVVRQGSIAQIYEEMGGNVFYIGKPHNKAYAAALERFNQHQLENPKEILMVGDTPETDIRGARRFGMCAALVTQTGIMADRISNKGLENALNELSAEDRPHYLIKRLGHEIRSSL